ncbi:MAG TPA: DUF1800 domain-containing protein [Blastocatellia bacterium]|nr:DUF1800 domain-containing protein [Blastocatellia bacterium]
MHTTLRIRFMSLLGGGLALALLFANPFAAQQQAPFDESRLIADLTNALQLTSEQTSKLMDLIDKRRPRIDDLTRQMSQFAPGSPNHNELRGQLDRERRSLLEELAPSLNPDQQTRLRGFLGATPGAPGNPPRSVLAPLKPSLPAGAFTDERLIPLPANISAPTRSRRTTASIPQLTSEQKILHLLNRAGFGPRPGDIDRVRQIGIEQYIEEQLNPEDLPDDFLARPLMALNTLQMSQFEILQAFEPTPVRPQPTPTPTPIPAPVLKAPPAPVIETDKGEMARPGESTQPQSQQPSMPQQPAMPQQATPQPPAMPQQAAPQQAAPQQPAPSQRPATPQRPAARDPQQPLRELQQAKLLRAIFSEKQLQEVMVDFWFNHFNVFGQKDVERWLLTPYERDVIRPHALGRFKDLLTAVAQSPAMLFYLDNFMSQMEQPAAPQKFDADGNPLPQPRRPGLNENYAREIMELHTLGVDGGYTQKDVIEVARCLTGWTIGPRGNMGFAFRPRIHDRGEKIVLGTRIAPGGGIEDGLRVLDILSKHPSTARFISRKLCQRFVADEPPQSLVDRVAEKFTDSGGNIREVVRAILTSPEFFSPKYYRNKVKSPLDLVASTIRATGASTDGASPMIQAVARMGAPLYLCQPPTGYDENSAEWLSSATLLERMNFAVALVGARFNGTRVDVSRFAPPGAINDQNRIIDQLLAAIVHSDVSPETRENLMRVLSDSLPKTTPVRLDNRATQKNNELAAGIVSLILGSREFQVK